MAQYAQFFVNTTHGSPTITGTTGTRFLTNVKPGQAFKIKGDPVVYQIANVVSDEELTLTIPFQGPTDFNRLYQITTDYTPNFNLAEVNVGDADWPIFLTKLTIRKIDEVLGLLSAGSVFKGTWDAETNTPFVSPAGEENQGHFYKVSHYGTTEIDGINEWFVGDTLISNGSQWLRIPSSEWDVIELTRQAAESAVNADESAREAELSEINAGISEDNAYISELNAKDSETNAKESERNAELSEIDAGISEDNAYISELNAKASEEAAEDSEIAASNSERNAKLSEINAGISEDNAYISELNAKTSEENADATLRHFKTLWLGEFEIDPVKDNEGNDLRAGMLYYYIDPLDVQNNIVKIYNGTAWVAAYASMSGALIALNNLEDVQDVDQARRNLRAITLSESISMAIALG